MIASVSSLLTMVFVPTFSGEYDLIGINGSVTQIEYAFNVIVEKFRDKGFYMDDMVLEKAATMSEVGSAMDSNVETINRYIASLNKALETNYLLGKEVLSVMSIDLINNDGVSVVEASPDYLTISLNNGQTVKINTTEVVSSLSGDVQTITHV